MKETFKRGKKKHICTYLFFMSSFPSVSFSGSLWGRVGFEEPLAPFCVIQFIPQASLALVGFQ